MIPLCSACIAGFENLTVWADLLDRINVFPVADGDTGCNLRISLAPMRDCGTDMGGSVKRLSESACGNSGNIAAAFFQEFLDHEGEGLGEQAQRGRDRAWQAIADPSPGTMLGVFDALCLLLAGQDGELDFLLIREGLQKAVLATASQLPELQEAGVVDSGALGMFLFFDGFFQKLTGQKMDTSPLLELFGDTLQLKTSFKPRATGEYCVEARLTTEGSKTDLSRRIASLGDSAVVIPGNSGLKIHLHTRNPEQLRKDLSSLGEVVDWSDEAMDPMILTGENRNFPKNCVRIMSDAAGSIPLDLARKHGIVLLDSYILTRDKAVPESLFSAELLYSLMREGIRVSTAQASSHERHLHYQAATEQYGKVLYLSTGSAFTGNYSTAMAWKETNDPENHLEVIDTGAASGRLAVIAILSARLAEQGAPVAEVISFAEELSRKAEEYVFLHELKYLVAGGRVTKTKAFFGDLLHMKPVISPVFEGVRKVGVVRNREAQLEFGIEKVGSADSDGAGLLVLLQYSDNKEWLFECVEPGIRRTVPEAEILMVPLSLTSGVHMGPGTWSIAFSS
ncbi:MAG: DegV family EDD domain-containing protein [Desulfocapsa sp.]|nr:DegV family EDD domain-containing protein [Desulfocapsa sp.]